MRITLRKKALLFFVLFELCMLAIFGTLLTLLQQAEAESLREERAKRIVGETQQLALVFSKAGDGVVHYCRDRDVASLKPLDEALVELPKKCDWLRAQFQDAPAERAVFARVDDNARDMLKIMRKVRGAVERLTTLESVALMEQVRLKVQPKLNELVRDIQILVEQEEAVLVESPQRARHQRGAYKQLVQAGFVATTILALLGLIVFLRDVIARLQLMEDNTQRLVRNQALHAPLAGKDEIAHLDSVFHDMAGALKEAQEVRKAFVAVVSHDLRSPLQSIAGFLELLEMGVMGEVSDKAMDGVTTANRNVQRLIRLINDLLDLEKMESGTIDLKLSVVSLKKILDDSIGSIESLAEGKQVQIIREYEDAETRADPDRMIQVVVNLLSNAIKFSEPGTSITLQSTVLKNGLEVRVIDSGRGVPEKYRELIFERFKQVDQADYSQKGGTGLGLPICKAIIEQHGGTIGVDSGVGKGSEFWFRIPMSESGLVEYALHT
jgi:signal transduction histidine kinase